MPDRDLDFRILRKNRRETSLSIFADPDNIPALQATLRGWLDGNGWDRGRWPEFTAEVRVLGQGKVLQRVTV